jgi:hypothetical protein
MARARNIKPGFFQNDLLGELDPLARLFFVGLWTIADFKGCLEFRPKKIKAQLLPYDECCLEKLAINLERSGFIRKYSVQGIQYLKIVNFERHQNPHKNEREAGSLCPDESQNDQSIKEMSQDGSAPDKNGTAPADSLFLIPSSLIPDTATRGRPERAPRFDAQAHLSALGVSDAVIADWLTLRKAKKAAATLTAIAGIEREAVKARITLQAALAMCCERGWAGFKAEWLNEARAGPTSRQDMLNNAARSFMNPQGIDHDRTIDITPTAAPKLGF